MRQKLQNSKGYAESPEFLPALGLFIFKKFANLQKNCTHICIIRTPSRSCYPVRLRVWVINVIKFIQVVMV